MSDLRKSTKRHGATQTRWRRAARRRRLPAAVLATCALVAGACGSASSSTGAAASTKSKQTVTVWETWSNSAPGLSGTEKSVNAAFERMYPEITVHDVSVSYSDLNTKLSAAITAQAGPNVVTAFPGVAVASFKNGLIPLQSYLTPSDKSTWELVNEAASPDGNTYAVPWTKFGSFFYYNKQLFEKAGLNPDDPPSTWAEFLSDCKALKQHGVTALSGGFADGYEWEWYAFPLLDQLMSKATTKKFLDYDLPLDGQPFTSVWSDIKGLGTSGYFAKDSFGLKLYPDAYNDFEGGKAAMLLDESYLPNLYTAQKDLGTKNVGVFPMPRLPGSQWPSFVDAGPGSGWAITKWTHDRTAAWDYINWMESKQAAALLWRSEDIIPSNTQASTPTTNKALASLLGDLKNPVNHSVYVGFPISVLAINERYASEMITGHTSIVSVLGQMEQLRQRLTPQIK